MKKQPLTADELADFIQFLDEVLTRIGGMAGRLGPTNNNRLAKVDTRLWVLLSNLKHEQREMLNREVNMPG